MLGSPLLRLPKALLIGSFQKTASSQHLHKWAQCLQLRPRNSRQRLRFCCYSLCILEKRENEPEPGTLASTSRPFRRPCSEKRANFNPAAFIGMRRLVAQASNYVKPESSST